MSEPSFLSVAQRDRPGGLVARNFDGDMRKGLLKASPPGRSLCATDRNEGSLVSPSVYSLQAGRFGSRPLESEIAGQEHVYERN